MKRVGWIIEPRKDGSWTVHASEARDYVFQLGFGWSVPLEEIEAALDADVKAL